MAALIFLPPAAKYLKKLKDKNLKRLYDESILGDNKGRFGDYRITEM